jgi:hypothetical protein
MIAHHITTLLRADDERSRCRLEILWLGQEPSYAAARRGDITTVQIGCRLFVPIAALERKLEIAGLGPQASSIRGVIPDYAQDVETRSARLTTSPGFRSLPLGMDRKTK